MQISSLLTLSSVKSLKKLMDSQKEIYLYGAGYYLEFFLQEIENLDKAYYDKIKCIFVSNADGSPEKVRGIPVFTYYPDTLGANDCVLLTLGHRYTDEVFRLLQGTGAHIAEIDFNMFQEIPYHEVKKKHNIFSCGISRKAVRLKCTSSSKRDCSMDMLVAGRRTGSGNCPCLPGKPKTEPALWSKACCDNRE